MNSATELLELDALGQAEAVASGEASPRELVEAAIARAERVNPVLNAVIHEFYEEARSVAEAGPPDGPFRAVPFLFKDLGACLAGQPLYTGSRVLKALDFRAPLDTTLALRFRQAGFVTLGKTNTPEFGILPTTEPETYGPTRNPWDTSRSPGGSSGGSGAAVAAGIAPVAHANDGGGSIRIPAAANGLVGFKPSRARVSQAPYVGDSMSGLVTEFVLTRSVRDAAAILDLVHGPEPGDPYAAPPPVRPFSEELSEEPGQMHIAVLTESLTGDQIDPEVRGAVEEVARQLEGMGHQVSSPDLPVAGQEEELYQTFITRWAAGVAETASTVEMVAGRTLGPDDFEPLTWALVEKGRSESGADYLHAVNRHQMLARMVAFLYEGGIDLVLTPTITQLPQPLGTYDDSGSDPMEPMHVARELAAFTGIFNATGQPAVSLPLAWSESGLPIGIQFVAPIWREDLLFRIASQLEKALPWAERRPPDLPGDDAG
jgi:amidase